MTVDRWLRVIGGAFVVVSALLGYLVHPGWLFFTLFVGLNLLQSGFTNWCPMVWVLRKPGAPTLPREPAP